MTMKRRKFLYTNRAGHTVTISPIAFRVMDKEQDLPTLLMTVKVDKFLCYTKASLCFLGITFWARWQEAGDDDLYISSSDSRGFKIWDDEEAAIFTAFRIAFQDFPTHTSLAEVNHPQRSIEEIKS